MASAISYEIFLSAQKSYGANMNYTVFGCNNPTGSYFLDLVEGSSVEVWGREKPLNKHVDFVFCDLTLPPRNSLSIKGMLVSFAPIWLISNYLAKAAVVNPSMVKDMTGIVAISSSSYLTKRFAFSNYDKQLSGALSNAHGLILDVSKSLNIGCHILAPSLVYGSHSGFRDRNISIIIKLIRYMPFIVVPKKSGLRQPIHASQLAQVTLKKVKDHSYRWNSEDTEPCTLGGDEIISYTQMIKRIQSNLPMGDIGRRCKVIEIPERLFFFLSAGILPINTRLFEAILRLNSNLSGFSKASALLGVEPRMFPVLPLPI
jgi:hypothetical protein